MPKLTEVFTPSSVPTYTYIDREKHQFEEQLREALRVPNRIVSLSGPSKSGKTVLLRKVVSKDNLIELSGAGIDSVEGFWASILSWMELPTEVSEGRTTSGEAKIVGKGGGEIGVPFVAQGKVEAGVDVSGKRSAETKQTFPQANLAQVAREIADSEFTVFVDDFHYIPEDVRPDIARQIKAGAERGIRFCTASVPHRSDDVVRNNPELVGRVKAINLKPWDTDELSALADKGFGVLNVKLGHSMIPQLVQEAFGSPQLMQSLCLDFGFEAKIDSTFLTPHSVDLSPDSMVRVFERTSTTMDYSSLVESLHGGPRMRGVERNKFDLVDGSRGDVYRAVLLAIRMDPGRLALTYDEMLQRVRRVCIGTDHPSGSSISQALEQMDAIAPRILKTQVLEWDEDTLDIVEPYFLFFLRKSTKLAALAT